MKRHFFKFRSLGVIIALGTIAVFAVVVRFLWNWIMPDIFGLPALDYWQALGILALSRILFSGIGGGFFTRSMGGFHNKDFRHQNPLREKWMNMSEEERKTFMEKEKDFRTLFHDRFSHLHEFYEDRETENHHKKEGGDE
jgi:hypothetical protein